MFKSGRIARIAVIATVAVAVLAGGAASASPGRHHHRVVPAGVFGTVASVNGTSTAGTCGTADTAGTFTLDAAHSTTDTVDVSTTTTFFEHGVTTSTFANVCVGDKVGAFGMVSAGTVTATSVFITPPKPPVVFGTVAAVNGITTAGTCGAADTAGAFTLDAAHSTTDTVDVSTTTTFVEHGVTTPTFANVCVGSKVAAVGADASNTVTATSVFISPPPIPKPHAIFGTVASVNGTSTAGTCGAADTAGAFTLDAAHSTTDTVEVSTTTTFFEHGVTTSTFGNVCVGDKVGAFGMVSAGTVTATSVFITPPKPPVVFGTVAAVNGITTAGTCGAADTAGAFTLDAAHSTTDTVDVSTTTTFVEHGVTTPTFANVCVGSKVAAVGADASNTVTATSVFISPPPTPKRHGLFGGHKGSTPGPKVDFGTHSTSGSPTSGPHFSGHGNDSHSGPGFGGSTNWPHSNGAFSGHPSH